MDKKIVAVLWRDSKIFTYKKDKKEFLPKNLSIGILIKENKEAITLANNMDFNEFTTPTKHIEKTKKRGPENSELIRYLIIPRGMIKKIVPIGNLSIDQFLSQKKPKIQKPKPTPQLQKDLSPHLTMK